MTKRKRKLHFKHPRHYAAKNGGSNEQLKSHVADAHNTVSEDYHRGFKDGVSHAIRAAHDRAF